MKVCLFIDSMGPGGAQRQLVGLANMLHAEGLETTICIYHSESSDSFYLSSIDPGVTFYILKGYKNKFNLIYKAWHFFRKEAPDVIISYLESPCVIASLCRLFGCRSRLIVSERNTTQRISISDKLRFLLFKKADFIVPNSYTQSQFIVDKYPSLSKKTVVIPNFVDLHFFRPVKHLRNETLIITIVATIWPSKNTLGFIDAVKELKEKGYRFRINWYGKSDAYIDYYNTCMEKIVSSGIEDNIKLLEKTNKIRDVYNNSDVFCLPSFYEGTPNVICEAMACGLPIICSDICDNGRYVVEGKNGFLFNPHETSSICGAIEKFFSLNNDQLTCFGEKSRKMAEDLFSPELFIRSYLKLICK